MQQPNFPLQSLIGVGLQLILSHLVAALIALWLAEAGGLAILVGVVAGLLMTATFLRTTWMVTSAIDRLAEGMPMSPLTTRGHLLLAALPVRLNVVIERVSSIAALHEGLVQRTSEAAAQQVRHRLARDLHDSIKQQIFSISMSAAAIEARWEHDRQSAHQALADVRQSAREALVEMTALLQQLSPAPLEKVGLVQALRDQCEALGYRTGAEVIPTFGKLPDDERLPHGTQESLFRIAQEALSNIARHARATQVQLELRQAGKTLLLEIVDDGQGFDREITCQGMGLGNIEQRVAGLGGRVILASTPGNGTRLSVMIPLQEILFTQEEKVGIQAEHTLNRTFLAGAAGGLLLIAALFYPLYIDWPGRFIEGWSQGASAISLACLVLAALLTVATGYAATRWAGIGGRAAGAMIGGLAGLVATTTAYIVLVSPAAGIAGSEVLLDHGYRPALDESHMLWLLGETIVNTVYWSYGTLWLVQLAGLLLGASGSLLAPAGTAFFSGPELRRVATGVAWLAVAINGLSFLVAQAIFTTLAQQVSGQSGAVPSFTEKIAPATLSLPPAGVYLLPVGTALLLLTLSLAAVYRLRGGQRAGDSGTILGTMLFSWYTVIQIMVAVSTWQSLLALPYNLLVVTMGTLLCVAFWGLFLKQERGRASSGSLRGMLMGILIAVAITLAGQYGSYASPALLTQLTLVGVGIVTGTLVFQGARRLRRLRLTVVSSPERAQYHWQNALNTLGIGFPMALLIMSQVIPLGLNLMLIAVKGIPALAAYEVDTFNDPAWALAAMAITPPEIVQTVYSTHAQFLLGTLLVIFVAEAILLGVLRLVQWLARRYGKRPLALLPGGQQA